MREILFRGKHEETGEWLEGDLYHRNDEVLITNFYKGFTLGIDTETVCQYTGLKDKNGKKIWEGDIVRFEGYGYMPEVEIGEVVFSRGCFGVEYLSKLYKALGHNDKSFHRIGKTSKWRDMGASGIITYTYEVLGNIFDNPELLEVTE